MSEFEVSFSVVDCDIVEISVANVSEMLVRIDGVEDGIFVVFEVVDSTEVFAVGVLVSVVCSIASLVSCVD